MSNIPELELLSNCPVCKSISKEAAHEMILNKSLKITQYKKGETIARQGDICRHLYILTKGEVTTEMITENGGLLTIEKMKAVKPLASAFLFAEKNHFPVDVIALEDCEVMAIPKDYVIQLFMKEPRFLQSYLEYNAGKTQFLTNKLQMVSTRTIRGKLAGYLMEQLMRCHSISPSINTFYTDKNQTELAKYFGVTRPALARILSEFQQEGIIKSERKKITVLNKSALQNQLG